MQSLLEDDYHHTGTMVWYKNDSPLEYIICDGSGEDPSCEYYGYSADDHLLYLDVYETCLEPNSTVKNKEKMVRQRSKTSKLTNESIE